MDSEQNRITRYAQALAHLGIQPGASRVLIVGLGVTGISVAKFLHRNQIDFAIVDSRTKPPGLSELQQISPDAPIFLGGYASQAFEAATHLVVSPGVAMTTPQIMQALDSGIVACSDIDLFDCAVDAPVIGITGSNGKSTVTSLVGMMAKKAGISVKVGGNLGPAALDLLDDDSETELYVLELSSFQLERTSNLKLAAATILNISPDHMDRYPSVESYSQAKQRIFNDCISMIVNVDDEWVVKIPRSGHELLTFGISESAVDFRLALVDGKQWLMFRNHQIIESDSLRIKGRHNLANALAALALGHSVGLSEASMVAALQVFPGLPHRMQWVDEINGVAWINDSKATNVGACLAALNGLTGKTVLIAGGDGKGADFSGLRTAIGNNVRAVILIGKDAPLIQGLIDKHVTTINAQYLEQAVRIASEFSKAGDTVLLSPACASLDQFSDYQHRGQVFEAAVRGLSRVA